MNRRRPGPRADERSMLVGWLDWQHATVLVKGRGLSDDDARRSPLATSPVMSVITVVTHLTSVERNWLQGSFLVDKATLAALSEDGWQLDDRSLEDVLQHYEAQCARTRQILLDHDLNELEAYAPPGLDRVSLRWILTHLIEETGRHLGHLDLLRELADGVRGE